MADFDNGARRYLKQAADCYGQKSLTMSGNVTVDDLTAQYISADPDGSDRTITIDAAKYRGPYIVRHAGSANRISIVDGSASEIASLQAGDSACIGSDGSSLLLLENPRSVSLTASVAYDDTSPKTLFTFPQGENWVVRGCLVVIGDGFDGTSADLDIGISGGDTDGYIDGSGVTSFPASASALSDHDAGALLWDDTEDSRIAHVPDTSSGAVNVIATITPGSGATAGSAIVILEAYRI